MIETATTWNIGAIDQHKAARRRATWSPLETPSIEELVLTANLLGLSIESLEIAAARGLLYCATSLQGQRSFVVTDSAKLSAAARRLDGQLWELFSTRTRLPMSRLHRYLPGSIPGWPIGVPQAAGFPAFAITETGTDLLCAMHLIWCAAREQIIAPLALLSRMPISQDALKSFRNKHICLFPHTDTPEEICNHWSDQLHEAGALAVEQYSFAELINPDGSPVQTLHDFLRIDAEVWLTHYDAIESAFLFGPAPIVPVAQPQHFSSTATIKTETANGGPF